VVTKAKWSGCQERESTACQRLGWCGYMQSNGIKCMKRRHDTSASYPVLRELREKVGPVGQI